ncbi:MAG: Gp49 family protein [Rubrivivax sp.]
MTRSITLEQELQALGLTAPRVTLADIDAAITDVEIVKHVSKSGQVLRWAVITVRNGFAVTGRPSAAVSPENDNAAVGERVAIDNAKAELWPLMGYALREKLASAAEAMADPSRTEDARAAIAAALGAGDVTALDGAVSARNGV